MVQPSPKVTFTIPDLSLRGSVMGELYTWCHGFAIGFPGSRAVDYARHDAKDAEIWAMTTTDERSDRLAIDDLRNAWVVLSTEERVLGFGLLSADQAEEFFLGLPGQDAAELLACLLYTSDAADERSSVDL